MCHYFEWVDKIFGNHGRSPPLFFGTHAVFEAAAKFQRGISDTKQECALCMGPQYGSGRYVLAKYFTAAAAKFKL